MMKKFLISLLLLVTLCSGSSFAWDQHPPANSGLDAAVLTDTAVMGDAVIHTEHTHNLSSDGQYQDDHCSHASAHVLGIFYDTSLKTQNADPGYYLQAGISLPYLYISPLLRPPIS